ncbi:MAG: TadE/TadG family type IV pilus assembly protein [Pseudomonadota bacterium]
MFKSIMKMARKAARRALDFRRDRRGSALSIFAVTMPVLMAGTAVSIDYAYLSNQRERLQALADLAAVASARELVLANQGTSQLTAVAKRQVEANRAATAIGNNPVNVDVAVDVKEGAVTVDLAQRWTPFFAHVIDPGVNPVQVTATARVMGQTAICLLGLLDYSLYAAIHMDDRASVSAPECGTYSNSTSRFSIRFDGNSSMVAASICSAGGVLAVGRRTAEPKPVTDCPKIDDPLEKRPAPSVGACDHLNFRIDASGPATVYPGVYCDGMEITGDADVTISPGVYVIKDGPLVVSGNARFVGRDVGFYLTGRDSTFDFGADTHISLEAPRMGPLAGLLFHEDLNVPYSFRINPIFPHFQPSRVRVHKIRSNDARQLLGTIYLPRSILMVDSDAPVADNSAFTAIVAARIWLLGGPTLVINADYAATEVPLPNGLAGGLVAITE